MNGVFCGWVVLVVVFVAGMTEVAVAGTGKMKVFILAGQSNMEGHAKLETFDYVGDDPATAPLLKKMRGADGQPRVAENAWISYFTGRGEENGEGFGKLTAGYGSRPDPTADGGKIGPEFTFGLAMDAAFVEPVLIIKTAWGGKSLFYDYRSPSSGVYEQTEEDVEKERRGPERCGHYYRLMIGHVEKVLADIGRVCPEYDAKAGYELAGFVWFQGFNDMVTRDVYPELPEGEEGNRFAKYSEWMGDLIRDVRKDLEAPGMPVVIGVMGVGGLSNEKQLDFRAAMAAPALEAEFRGNVAAVETAPFWSDELDGIAKKRDQVGGQRRKLSKKVQAGEMTRKEMEMEVGKIEAELISEEEAELWARGASNQGYHYLGCAKTFAVMGEAFAAAVLEMR
jgi:hypothetical protein